MDSRGIPHRLGLRSLKAVWRESKALIAGPVARLRWLWQQVQWLLRTWMRWSFVTFPSFHRLWRFVEEILRKYQRDDCFTYAASISFFLTISLIPLTTLFFKLLALSVGRGAYGLRLQGAITQMYPFLPLGFIQDTIQHSKQIGGWGISYLILLIGAHWGVNQLDRSLSHIFGLRVNPHQITRKYNLARRLLVLLVGLTILVIMLTAGFEWALRKRAPFSPGLAITLLPSLLGLALVTLILQHLPRRHVKFRHALLGAVVSTAMWWVAKWGFGLYLEHTPTWGILYGSLGSLMAALVFLYYSCCIFLLGAEVTAAFYRHDSSTQRIERRPRGFAS